MESARFGRMKVGRCLATSYYVGCYADVMPLLDYRCSGHHECNLKVLDDDLLQYQPCRKDLMSYLEAAYTCISGELTTHAICIIRVFLCVEQDTWQIQVTWYPVSFG